MRGWSIALAAGTVALALLLSCCGGSSICSRWNAQTAKDARAARRYGQKFVQAFQGLPAGVKQGHAAAVAYYRVAIAKDRATPSGEPPRAAPRPPFDVTRRIEPTSRARVPQVVRREPLG